jgi:hypothetical protein
MIMMMMMVVGVVVMVTILMILMIQMMVIMILNDEMNNYFGLFWIGGIPHFWTTHIPFMST